MPEAPRITADDLKRRMDAGEDFTVVDTRNPQAWAEAPDMASGAIRVAADEAEDALPRIPRNRPIVAYCT